MNARDVSVHWLKKHTQDAQRAVSQFTTGGFMFAGGIMIVLLADRYMPDSLNQELFALFGLILIIIGCGIALWGYLSISLFKIIIYLLEKNDKP